MSEHVRAALTTIVEGGTLSLDEARLAMGAVMDGEATPAQLAALLMGLRMRGETVDELAGFATAMRERVVRVEAPEGTVDVVGTGGDGSGTFNISTAVGAGRRGGRRAGRQARQPGDHLEVGLGGRARRARRPDRPRRGVRRRPPCVELGFAFLFAPNFHPAMRHAGPTRKEIGVRTAFNLLGPLTNPAGTRRQLLGVGDAAGGRRGSPRSSIGSGPSGRSSSTARASTSCRSTAPACSTRSPPTGVEQRVVDAVALGLQAAATSKLAGGDAATTNARLRGGGPPRRARARGATSCCSTPARRSWRRHGRDAGGRRSTGRR